MPYLHPDRGRLFSDAVTTEGMFYAVPVLFAIGATVWAIVSDDE